MTVNNKNYYEILKLIKENKPSYAEIKKAYRDLALKYHPDKKGAESSEEKMKELNEAYEVLGNEELRRKYDDNGSELVKKHAYDYGEEVSTSEGEVGRHWGDDMYWIHARLVAFDQRETDMISDYVLIRAKKLLQALSVYKKIYNSDSQKFNFEVGMKLNGFQWWSGSDSWEGNVNRFKRLLNNARRKLGLDDLTDNDLQIGSNIPNETPQIPDKDREKPKPIENGVVNVEEYNNQYSNGDHEDIRKYKELRGKIYDTAESWSKYGKVNPALLKEIDDKAKKAEMGNFRSLLDSDDKAKIEEVKKFNESKLTKMKEVMKLMEKIIEEGKNYNPEVESVQSGDKKRKADDEFEIFQENLKKSKTDGDELTRLIDEAKGLNNYEELESKIKDIDKYQGEEVYSNFQEEIKKLKTKLISLDKDKYREKVLKEIKAKLNESGLTENDLDEATKNKLNKLENGEEVSGINEFENQAVAKIGEKKAENNLNKWLKEAKELVENVKTGTVDYLRGELKKIKEGLYGFRHSTNVYEKKIYQDKEQDIQEALDKLENYTVTTQPSGGFFQPKVIIPVALVAVVLTAAAVVIIRNRKQKKVK